jgi:hypothetical protein
LLHLCRPAVHEWLLLLLPEPTVEAATVALILPLALDTCGSIKAGCQQVVRCVLCI